MAEEKEKEELSQEEEPKAEKKALTTNTLIMIITATVLLNVVIVFFAIKFFTPDANEEQNADSVKLENKADDFFREDSDEDKFFDENQNHKMIQTGRITTNPANTIKKFIVTDLGFEYKIKPEYEEHYKEDSDNMNRFMTQIKSHINKYLGSRNLEELVTERADLDYNMKIELQPIFKKNKMYLKQVYIKEFLVQ